jgi:UDP-3-O-[3-hydroxymyristoyl] glucosamine N-acyltransferase
MKVDALAEFLTQHDASSRGMASAPDALTGWAHYEDAAPGDISWYRHELPYAYQGSALICSRDAYYPHALQPGQLLVRSKDPRNLIAALLKAHAWNDPMTAAFAATTGVQAQDYIWRERWESIVAVGGVRLGEDVTIGYGAHVVAGTLGLTTIGDGCRIGHGCNIGHDVRIGRDTLVLAHAMIGGWARIGAQCRIYMGAMIKNGVTVGDKAVIGMGAVVRHDVPAGETWAGNPARRVK